MPREVKTGKEDFLLLQIGEGETIEKTEENRLVLSRLDAAGLIHLEEDRYRLTGQGEIYRALGYRVFQETQKRKKINLSGIRFKGSPGKWILMGLFVTLLLVLLFFVWKVSNIR